MNYFCLLAVLIFAYITSTEGAGKNESCDSTSQCADTGLTCSGHRCVCLLDLGRKAGQTWACNSAFDCDSINTIAKRTLEISDFRVSREPACIPSTVCPNFPGTLGYCDVLMAA